MEEFEMDTVSSTQETIIKTLEEGIELFFRAEFQESLAKLKESEELSLSFLTKARAKFWCFRIIYRSETDANCLSILEEIEECIEKIRDSEIREFFNAELDFCYGLFHSKRGDFQKAIESFKISKTTFFLFRDEYCLKRMIDCHLCLGDVYFKLENYQQNQARCEIVLQLLKEVELQGIKSYHYGESLVHYALGRLNSRLNFLNSAKEHFSRSLQIQNDNQVFSELGGTLLEMGIVYRKEHKFDDALDFLRRAESCYEDQGNSLGKAVVLENRSIISEVKRNIPGAINLQKEVLRIRTQLEDEKGIANSELELGRYYLQVKQPNEAKMCFKNALKLFDRLKIENEADFCLRNLGRIEKENGSLVASFVYFQKSLNICTSIENFDEIKIAWTHYEIAEICTIVDSLHHLQCAMSLFRNKNLRFEMGLCQRGLGERYEKCNDFKNSIKHYEVGIKYFRKIDSGKFLYHYLSEKVRFLRSRIEKEFFLNLRENLRELRFHDFEIVKEIGIDKRQSRRKSAPVFNFKEENQIFSIKRKFKSSFPEVAVKIVPFCVIGERKCLETIEDICAIHSLPVEHENLCSVYHTFISRHDDDIFKRGKLYLISPKYSMNLQQKINRSVLPFNEIKFLTYFCQMLEGINVLKENGIVHCNLTRKNVVFTEGDNLMIKGFESYKHFFGEYFFEKKNLDFELCKAHLPLEFLSAKVGEEVDFSKVDIFSGALLGYSMLSNLDPFGNENPRDRCMEKYIELPDEISDEIRNLLRKMIHTNENERLGCKDALTLCRSILESKMKEIEDLKIVELNRSFEERNDCGITTQGR